MYHTAHIVAHSIKAPLVLVGGPGFETGWDCWGPSYLVASEKGDTGIYH